MNTALKARASALVRTDLSPEDWPSPKIAGHARDDIRRRMVSFLPRLRRFAHSLTRDQERSEDLVPETCARALARSVPWLAATHPHSWVYRLAQNTWAD